MTPRALRSGGTRCSAARPTRSADFEEARVALIAAARGLPAADFCSFDLLFADQGEDGAEPLVLDNRGLRDVAQLVEGTVGERDTLVADR